MINDDFYKNSFILTLSNLSTAILRFLFSVVLSRELGSEGLGLYALIMPVYDLFCCLICGGMVTSLSKETAKYYNKKDYANLMKSVKVSFVFNLIWGLFVTSIFLLLCPFISKHIIQDNRSIYPLLAISPALILVALSSLFKGFFYGTSKVKIPSIIDIFEKALRMIAIIVLMRIINEKSITFTVTITYISLTLGELLSFILLFFYYKHNRQRLSKGIISEEHTRSKILKSILIAAIPLCINGLLTTALSSFSTLILPRRLILAGITYTEALSVIGKFSGMALTIVFFPSFIILSFCTLLIPEISKYIASKDLIGMERRLRQVMEISFYLGMINMIICIVIPNQLGIIFYSRTDIAPYIVFLAVNAPILYLSSCTYSILNGIGLQSKVLINSLISSVLEVVLLFVLLAKPSINIYGYGIAMFISNIISFVMNFYFINRFYKTKFTLKENLIPTLICAICLNISLIIRNYFTFMDILSKTVVIVILGFTSFIFITVHIKKNLN
ncbi:stage V sporulation protein B [Hathewaya proteolytica DSM 3090]|uniref:Stage V sporulation protein B n=1 Tax=Hathewaya proteolytica DSM 3090 TaxID=1121331 RepID=A0A1M6LFW6_9CLOT|nr:stage V sporulation protein B [Hathewaya proteolytica]SHJ70131.1 stage V sporulation protein B [Hathewaya proteolytica DSM 3090]